MRVHIELDDELIAKVDDLAGRRGRSGFVRSAVERAVAQELRWASLESAAGSLSSHQHDWNGDPATWVRAQRHADERRAG